MAANFVPYLLFGLVIGAWVDRLDRKRMMIAVDLARGAVIALIPLLSTLGVLHVWHVYLVGFVSSTLTIFFEAGAFLTTWRQALADVNRNKPGAAAVATYRQVAALDRQSVVIVGDPTVCLPL